MNRKSALAAAALVLCTFTGSTSAGDSLQTRAAAALGQVIASQGNAALVEIRRELKESLLQQFKPFLPKPSETAPAAPAKTPTGR